MEDDWRCEILDSAESARLFEGDWGDLSLEDHGTIVLWDDLDELSAGSDGVENLIPGS